MSTKAKSLSSENSKTQTLAIDMGGKSKVNIYDEISPTLTTTHYGAPAVLITKGKNNE